MSPWEGISTSSLLLSSLPPATMTAEANGLHSSPCSKQQHCPAVGIATEHPFYRPLIFVCVCGMDSALPSPAEAVRS